MGQLPKGSITLVEDIEQIEALEPLGQLAHGADDLRMAGMADQQHVTAALVVDLGLAGSPPSTRPARW
jgi:hypothetical protein